MFGTKLGYVEYCAIPEDGLRHEVIDGVHFVNPSPFSRHQSNSILLATELVIAIHHPRLGRVVAAPMDVQLSEHDIVQPDIVVVLNDNKQIITETHIVGAPDLVVEILSKSTRRLDRERKFALYERSGIREYWIVDTDARVIDQFVLVPCDSQHRRYDLRAQASASLQLAILPDVTIELARVWE